MKTAALIAINAWALHIPGSRYWLRAHFRVIGFSKKIAVVYCLVIKPAGLQSRAG